MRLLEAIIQANHAASAGRTGEVNVAQFAAALPLAALTCIDPRLNKLFPGALGLKDEQFIWLRNAGNVITSSTSSTVRSVAMSVFLKGAKEIAVIGHTDCKMSKIVMADLLDRLKAAGLDRTALPIPNLHEFFGLFSSEKPNVVKAVGYLRSSPVIPPRMPMHGLIIDSATGRLDWVVNGYEAGSLPLAAGLNLSAMVSTGLPANVPGYVAGPVKSFAENIEPLLNQKLSQATAKIAEKIADHVKPAAVPPVQTPPVPKKQPPTPRDRGPYR